MVEFQNYKSIMKKNIKQANLFCTINYVYYDQWIGSMDFTTINLNPTTAKIPPSIPFKIERKRMHSPPPG